MPAAESCRNKHVLQWGELSEIARATGRSVSHIARIIKRERQSATLEAQIERLTGYRIDCIELPRSAA